jgi:hypothetical protein
MKALLFQSSALILLDCECRLCFNSYFDHEKTPKTNGSACCSGHKYTDVCSRKELAFANYPSVYNLLQTFSTYSGVKTYSRIYNLLRPISSLLANTTGSSV